MPEIEIWKVLSGYGIPGLALGVLYLLFKKFHWKFAVVPKTWVGPIVVLFMLIVGTISFYALTLWAPGRDAPGSEYSEKFKQENSSVDNTIEHVPALPSLGTNREDRDSNPKGLSDKYNKIPKRGSIAVNLPVENEPELSLYGTEGEGYGVSPERPPLIHALDAGTLTNYSIAYFKRDWDDILPILQSHDRSRTSNTDDKDAQRKFTVLPGLIVFALQNTGGRDSPTIKISELSILGNISKDHRDIENEDIVIMNTHQSSAAMYVPAIRGKVLLGNKVNSHNIEIPKPYDNPFALFRDHLGPGDESVYVIEIDTNLYGIYKLDLTLRVSYQFLSSKKTKNVVKEFPHFIEEIALKPKLEQISEYYYYDEEPLLVSRRPDLSFSDIWDYSGINHDRN